MSALDVTRNATKAKVTDIFKPDLFKGKVAFITGGGTGIGKGFTRALMDLGANTIISSRRVDVIRGTAEELSRHTSRECLAVAADVRDYKSLEEAISKGVAKFGRLDYVICNAAGNFLALAEDLTVNAFKTVIEIDLLGTWNTVKAAFPYLKESKGAIIATSATLHYRGTPYQVHPSAAKAGVDAMIKTLAQEWGKYGIRANIIAPGPIADTEGMRRLSDTNLTEESLWTVPLGSWGTVADCEHAMV